MVQVPPGAKAAPVVPDLQAGRQVQGQGRFRVAGRRAAGPVGSRPSCRRAQCTALCPAAGPGLQTSQLPCNRWLAARSGRWRSAHARANPTVWHRVRHCTSKPCVYTLPGPGPLALRPAVCSPAHPHTSSSLRSPRSGSLNTKLSAWPWGLNAWGADGEGGKRGGGEAGRRVCGDGRWEILVRCGGGCGLDSHAELCRWVGACVIGSSRARLRVAQWLLRVVE